MPLYLDVVPVPTRSASDLGGGCDRLRRGVVREHCRLVRSDRRGTGGKWAASCPSRRHVRDHPAPLLAVLQGLQDTGSTRAHRRRGVKAPAPGGEWSPAGSIFKPPSDEALAQVDIHLPELALTAIDEFVGRACRGNDDLPCPRFERSCANHIRSHALLDNEYLFIRMLMQPYTLSWLHVNQNEGNVGVCMQVSLKL